MPRSRRPGSPTPTLASLAERLATPSILVGSAGFLRSLRALAWVVALSAVGLPSVAGPATAQRPPEAPVAEAESDSLPEIPPNADEEGYSVEIRQVDARPMAAIRFRVAAAEISARLAEILPKVYAYVEQQGLEPGTPFSIYHGVEGDQLDMEAGVLVSGAGEAPARGTDEIRFGALPAGEALFTLHPGSYTRLTEAHRALDRWLAKHERSGGVTWELYVTDPGQEPDERRWRTEVYRELEPASD